MYIIFCLNLILSIVYLKLTGSVNSKGFHNKENIIYGLDAHSTDDLYRIRKIKNQFMNYFKIKSPHKIDIISFINWFIEKPYE